MTTLADHDSPVLATIALDTEPVTRGDLYWAAEMHGIACRKPDGSIENTAISCDPSEAEPAIEQSWGERRVSPARRVWDLSWESSAGRGIYG